MKAFRKPLLVASVILVALLGVVTGYLAKTGVLAAARSYPAVVERAHELCFPIGSAELAQKFPIVKSDGVIIAKEICAGLSSGLPRLDAARPSVGVIPLSADAEQAWRKVQPALRRLEELREAKQWAGEFADPARGANDSVQLSQIDPLARLAGRMANAERIAEACELWLLYSYLVRANGENTGGGVGRFMELGVHAKQLKEFDTFATRWGKNSTYQKCREEWLGIALRKVDYRKIAWREANFLDSVLASRDSLGGSWSSPLGRSMMLNSREPFRTATRAENMRPYLEHFHLLEADPYSAMAFDGYLKLVRADHERANSISADFLREFGPIRGIGAGIAKNEASLRSLATKYK